MRRGHSISQSSRRSAAYSAPHSPPTRAVHLVRSPIFSQRLRSFIHSLTHSLTVTHSQSSLTHSPKVKRSASRAVTHSLTHSSLTHSSLTHSSLTVSQCTVGHGDCCSAAASVGRLDAGGPWWIADIPVCRYVMFLINTFY